jgi:dienelactone hydrolase
MGILMASCLTALRAQAPELRELVDKNHLVFTPPGPGPFPTVVAVPGCSGVAFSDPGAEANHPGLREDDRLFRRHYPRTADRLAREGFVVLLINVHRGEGVVTACGGEIPAERIAQYIDAAVAWAEGLDFVDDDRIHVMGWSMGGGGVLAWLRGIRTQSEAVRSAIAVYPDCSVREPLTSRVPLLMLLGGADDIALLSECEDVVEETGASSRISVRIYPGARHGYDISDAPAVVDIGGGMTIGFQQAAAEATWLEIVEFLDRGR